MNDAAFVGRKDGLSDNHSAATPDISFKIDADTTARSGKSEMELTMDRLIDMFREPQRDGISKEERRKRTKMKKAAKKQRRK